MPYVLPHASAEKANEKMVSLFKNETIKNQHRKKNHWLGYVCSENKVALIWKHNIIKPANDTEHHSDSLRQAAAEAQTVTPPRPGSSSASRLCILSHDLVAASSCSTMKMKIVKQKNLDQSVLICNKRKQTENLQKVWKFSSVWGKLHARYLKLNTHIQHIPHKTKQDCHGNYAPQLDKNLKSRPVCRCSSLTYSVPCICFCQ